ncbi:glycosyltransferase [Quadrisphaera sp. GCM10027208]|uniref:glycosyltransferase n=1 Tax=Quadrisphaera sp. GCM10027208 TaxID=3273423 RepID=UPI003615DAAB
MHEPRGRSLAVVTPWYPNVNNPFAGSFVQSTVEAVADRFESVLILHAEDWPTPGDRVGSAVIRGLTRRLVGAEGARVPIRPVRTPEGDLIRVPAPVVPARDYAQHARTHESALRNVLPGGVIDADVVHGHVGTYGGWAAVQLARPGARVFVTEHATFLDRILAQRPARDLYDQVLARCTGFFCVSDVLRRKVLDYFPHHETKVSVVPNAVAVERIPMRPDPVRRLSRWLYLGRLLPHKGVWRLLEAFAVCAEDDPDLELTMVGGGPLRDGLAARASELGLGGRVHLPGPVPHEEVVRQLHAADLLVHLSEYETFGMTVVEAVASGLPALVTRSGGPEETLAGLEEIAGATVPVSTSVVEVVRAYRSLRERLPDLDLPHAREQLTARYGMRAVGDQLMARYLGHDGPETPEVLTR